jgi:hypothetical protein
MMSVIECFEIFESARTTTSELSPDVIEDVKRTFAPGRQERDVCRTYLLSIEIFLTMALSRMPMILTSSPHHLLSSPFGRFLFGYGMNLCEDEWILSVVTATSSHDLDRMISFHFDPSWLGLFSVLSLRSLLEMLDD